MTNQFATSRLTRRGFAAMAGAAEAKCVKKGAIGECYNIGGGTELPNLEVIETLCQALDRAFEKDPALAERFPHSPAAKARPTSSLKQHITDRLGHDRRYAIDAGKIRRELGWSPEYDFASGIRRTVEWYLNHPQWIARVGSGAYRRERLGLLREVA